MFVNDSIFICSFPSCILAQVFIIIHKLPNLLHLKYNEQSWPKDPFFKKTFDPENSKRWSPDIEKWPKIVSLPIFARKFKLLPHLFSCCAKFDANATFLMHFVPTFLAQKFKWMRPNLFWVKSLFFLLFSFKENGGSGEGKLHVTSVKLKSGSKTKFVPTYDSSIPLNPWSKVSMSGYMVSRIKKVMPSLVEKMILRIAHVVEKLE